jgi:hypothetical protein
MDGQNAQAERICGRIAPDLTLTPANSKKVLAIHLHTGNTRPHMDTLAHLLQLKQELQKDFERDMANLDEMISRRTSRQQTETRNGSGSRELFEQERRGRPGTVVETIRDAIRMGDENFDLPSTMKVVDTHIPGHRLSRKAVSSGLARLAYQGELRIVKPGVNGGSPTVYAVTEKFPPARS